MTSSGGRKFTYQYWEDRLPEVRMGPYNEAADALLIKANSLRRTINPIGKKDRLLSAIRIYRKILEEYPNSAAVEPAAFGLGECFSHSLIGDYRRSVKFYEMCYIANGKSDHDPLYRAAKVLDSQLSDYDTACKYYEMAAKTSSSGWSRRGWPQAGWRHCARPGSAADCRRKKKRRPPLRSEAVATIIVRMGRALRAPFFVSGGWPFSV